MSHLRLLPSVPTVPASAGILQGELLIAAFAWSADVGWSIQYFVDSLPAEVQGDAWSGHFFSGTEQPIATSDAPRHPSLRLLSEEQRDAVRRIASKVIGELERGIVARAQLDAA